MACHLVFELLPLQLSMELPTPLAAGGRQLILHAAEGSPEVLLAEDG